MDLLKNFQAIIKALNTFGVEYILIGGYAVILHGLPRTTMDMDLMLKMNEQNIRKFREALKSIYNDRDIEEINLNELKKYAVIRYGTPDHFYIDIMTRIGDIADFENIAFEEKEIEGLVIKLATPEALYKLKSQSLRPQDQSDALFLRELLNQRGD